MKNNKSIMWGILLVIIGVIYGLNSLDIIDYDLIWKLVFPLIVVGLSLIFKDHFNSKITKKIDDITDNKNNGITAVFSGEEVSFENRVFTGGNLTSIFGGIKCDLREAKIKKDTVINAYSFFGGTDILVPDNVKIAVSSTSIFGGVDIK